MIVEIYMYVQDVNVQNQEVKKGDSVGGIQDGREFGNISIHKCTCIYYHLLDVCGCNARLPKTRILSEYLDF